MKTSALSIYVLSCILIEASLPAQADSLSQYNQLFPRSAEFCAATELSKKSGIEPEINVMPGVMSKLVGGQFGHGITYIQGACRDMSSSYPKIKICNPKTDTDTGVGITADRPFKSVNWMAVQDRNFFFRGLLSPGQTLTKEIYQQTKQQAKNLDILRGVTMHQKMFLAPPTDPQEDLEFRIEDSIGTDFAVSNARSLYCVRVPMSSRELSQFVDYFNSFNEHYHKTQDYVWLTTNNCTTSPHNAFASAGILNFVPADDSLLGNLRVPLGEFTTPFDTLLNLVERTNDLPLDDLYVLFQDQEIRQGILQRGELPMRPGAIFEYIPVTSPNEVYDTDVIGVFFDLPLLKPRKSRMKNYMTMDRYQDLRTNLLYFQKQLLRIQQQHETDPNAKDPELYYSRHFSNKIAGPNEVLEFIQFHQKFYQYVDQTLQDINAKVAQLEE